MEKQPTDGNAPDQPEFPPSKSVEAPQATPDACGALKPTWPFPEQENTSNQAGSVQSPLHDYLFELEHEFQDEEQKGKL